MYNTEEGKMRAVLMFVLFVPVAAAPAAADDWRGFFARAGLAYGQGDFAMTHRHGQYPFGSASLPTRGELVNGAVGYRWPLGAGWYAGVKGEIYQGDLTGSRTFSYGDASVTAGFSTTLTATLGGQLAHELDREGRWLSAIGAGVAGSKVAAHLSGTSPDFSASWGEDDGVTMGTYVELEVARRLGQHAAVYGNLKQVFYQGNENCRVAEYNCGQFKADTKPLVLGFGVEWRF